MNGKGLEFGIEREGLWIENGFQRIHQSSYSILSYFLLPVTTTTNISKQRIFFNIRNRLLTEIIEQLRLTLSSLPHIFRRHTLERSLLHIANQSRLLHIHRDHAQPHPLSLLARQRLHLRRRGSARHRHFAPRRADNPPPHIARRHQIADQNNPTPRTLLSSLLRLLERSASLSPPLRDARAVDFALRVDRRPFERRFLHPAARLLAGFDVFRLEDPQSARDRAQKLLGSLGVGDEEVRGGGVEDARGNGETGKRTGSRCSFRRGGEWRRGDRGRACRRNRGNSEACRWEDWRRERIVGPGWFRTWIPKWNPIGIGIGIGVLGWALNPN